MLKMRGSVYPTGLYSFVMVLN